MNAKLSERLAVVACIDPDAYGTGTQTSDWIDLTKFGRVLFIVMAGTMVSNCTLDFQVHEATDSSGTGAQAISGKAITQLTEAGTDSDKQAVVEVQSIELSSGFTHVAGKLILGTAGSDSGVIALAGDARYLPASDYDLATVDEIVS